MKIKTYLYFRHVRFSYWDGDGNLRQREGHGTTASDAQIYRAEAYEEFLTQLRESLERQYECKIIELVVTSLSLIGSTETEGA